MCGRGMSKHFVTFVFGEGCLNACSISTDIYRLRWKLYMSMSSKPLDMSTYFDG
eukprot:m.79547 g.79547  ORF g.79547 m.79547 type:complete len:54 (+) comp14517_c0_seq1:136-297(+)